MTIPERIERACALMPLTVHQLAQSLGTTKRYIRAQLPHTRACQCGTVKGSGGRPWNLWSCGK